MCVEEMTIADLEEALTEAIWQVKFLTDEQKRIINKLKTQEFLKSELEKRIEDARQSMATEFIT